MVRDRRIVHETVVQQALLVSVLEHSDEIPDTFCPATGKV